MKAIISLLLISSYCTASNGIIFKLNGGRFGDNILNFCKHQWMAYKYKMQLFVPDFKYKESLPLATLAKSPAQIKQFSFRQVKNIQEEGQIDAFASSCLYKSNFYFHINGVNDKNNWSNYIFQLSIEYPSFGTLLKTMLTPRYVYQPAYHDRISVALHIRKGGGYDSPPSSQQYNNTIDIAKTRSYRSADKIHPLKFPPEQYYIEQLQSLYDFLGEKLYVYMFTDDQNPKEILNRIKAHFQHTDIIFDCRTTENSPNHNILFDIYCISKFDYLIRSGSHFPWVSQIIGNHKGIIYPKGFSWQGNYLKMNNVVFVQVDRKNNKIIETVISHN